MSSEQCGQAPAWPPARTSAEDPWPAETLPEALFTSGVALTGRCKFPGCVNPRQPRLNRRGAPPAYCAEPSHEPDAARRERRRRQRLELPTDAPLDEHDQPLDETELGTLPSPSVVQSAPGTPPELPHPRAALELSSPQARTAPEEAEVPTPSASGARAGPQPHSPAEQARRLAGQLALAAEAYEQLAEAAAVTEAENAELRERLHRLEQVLSAAAPGRQAGRRPRGPARPTRPYRQP